MDQSVFRLLTVALVSVNLHSALTVPSDKSGVCPKPKDLPDICYLIPVCHTDHDCEGNFKCCFNGCGNDCVKPVSCKQGSCPRVRGLGLCVERCVTDTDCGENLKCCPNGCGHECVQPAPPLPAKPGVCPRPIPHLTTCEDKCCTDNDCDANKKCCYSGCGMRCAMPRPCRGKKVEKKGSCPRVRGLGLCVERCFTDTDCGENLKCCSNGCGHECMQPAPPLPAKPGVCPRPVPHLTTCEDKCCTDNDCDANQKCCYSGCGMHCVKPRPRRSH